MPTEFELIQLFFNRAKHYSSHVIQGIGDDAAVLQIPPHQQLVLTTDTLVQGRHFPSITSPFDIGYKSLAVNLSDLAAMGAKPKWILLALTLPDANRSWLTGFSQGFFSLLDRFQCDLIGGDLTAGPLAITVQACGLVLLGKVLYRSGAKPGDYIYVTGTLGDASFALDCLQKDKLTDFSPEERSFLLMRLNRPEPRVSVGLAIHGLASSAIDLSDGLAADLSHILAASQVGATINLTALPLSTILGKLDSEEAWPFALNKGDDYELCFTVPETHITEWESLLPTLDCTCTCIGRITKKKGLFFQREEGSLLTLQTLGYQHFNDLK